MVCCLLCFAGEPVAPEKCTDVQVARYAYGNRWRVGLLQAPAKQPLCFLATCLLPCATTCAVRQAVLDRTGLAYACCQDYYGCGGRCGEARCPAELCLCLESTFCLSCAVISTRQFYMDQFDVAPDPWDNRLIRCNNCLQLGACACQLAACLCCDERLRDGARLLSCAADVVFLSLVGCMTAQLHHELHGGGGGGDDEGAPILHGGGGGGGGGGTFAHVPSATFAAPVAKKIEHGA